MTHSEFKYWLQEIGLKPGQHVLMHASYRRVRDVFPNLTIEALLATLCQIVTAEGSLIMPTFSYCFKKSDGSHEVYDLLTSPSKVGAISEVFRKLPGVIRTASATHSFGLWGKITAFINADNQPASPLGRGSVLDWLAHAPESYILMLGTDFSAFSFGHYLEIKAALPWLETSPWKYLKVLPIGVSVSGEQVLHQVPGCAKSFVNFERYLFEHQLISYHFRGSLRLALLPITTVLKVGEAYFRNHPDQLLCPPMTCPACDTRRRAYLEPFLSSHQINKKVELC